MDKFRKNAVGFSLVEVLLLLVIVGILGFTGWFVWQAKHNTDTTLSETTKSANSKPSSAATSKNNSPRGNITTFKNAATLKPSDKEQIMTRIVNPLVFYQDNVLKIPLKSVVVDNIANQLSANDSRYTLNYVYANQPGAFGFVFGENNIIGYWQPLLCDEGGCKEYPTALKTAFPENYKAYVTCKTAREAGDKAKVSSLDCM